MGGRPSGTMKIPESAANFSGFRGAYRRATLRRMPPPRDTGWWAATPRRDLNARRTDGAFPFLDLEPVRLIVLQQKGGHVAQHDDTDALLNARARPTVLAEGTQYLKIRLAGVPECFEPLAQRARAVMALARHLRAVKVGQRRVLLLAQAADAHCKPLTLEIGEVPHLFDRRKRSARSGQPCPVGVEFMELLVQVSGHRRQRAQEPRALGRVEPGELHTIPGGKSAALH